jgi:2-phospho-L-lactate/phosphoenolpyruvate guanylyltransferase
MMMKAVLIPLKDPIRAKTRLAELLSLDERRRLVWAMFEDVSRAVRSARKPDCVVMVTSYEPAIERARELEWEVLIEESQVSESASVDWASRVLAERGADTVMRLPADLPLVRAEDIDVLLSVRSHSRSAVMVPSREGTGTNAIIRTPPALFPSRFGPNSLALHKQEAAKVGVECTVVENARIALDIDEPGDVEIFLNTGRGTGTFDLLVEMGIAERLKTGSRKDRKDSQRTQSQA